MRISAFFFSNMLATVASASLVHWSIYGEQRRAVASPSGSASTHAGLEAASHTERRSRRGKRTQPERRKQAVSCGGHATASRHVSSKASYTQEGTRLQHRSPCVRWGGPPTLELYYRKCRQQHIWKSKHERRSKNRGACRTAVR